MESQRSPIFDTHDTGGIIYVLLMVGVFGFCNVVNNLLFLSMFWDGSRDAERVITTAGTNVHVFTPEGIYMYATFAFCAELTYLLIPWLIWRVVRRNPCTMYSFEPFVHSSYGDGLCASAPIGFLHMLLWMSGMEGNVFGFLFAFPLLICAFAQIVIYVVLMTMRVPPWDNMGRAFPPLGYLISFLRECCCPHQGRHMERP